MKLSPAQIAAFEEEGYLFLPNVFSAEEMALLTGEMPGMFAQERPEVIREKDSRSPRSAFYVQTWNPVYEMVAETSLPQSISDDLASRRFDAVLCYSRRTAEIFCTLVADIIAPEARRHLPIICLSENVAQPLLEHRFSRVLLADHPSEEAMMTLALAFAREQTGS